MLVVQESVWHGASLPPLPTWRTLQKHCNDYLMLLSTAVYSFTAAAHWHVALRLLARLFACRLGAWINVAHPSTKTRYKLEHSTIYVQKTAKFALLALADDRGEHGSSGCCADPPPPPHCVLLAAYAATLSPRRQIHRHHATPNSTAIHPLQHRFYQSPCARPHAAPSSGSIRGGPCRVQGNCQ